MPESARPTPFPRFHPRQLQRLRLRLRGAVRDSGLGEVSASLLERSPGTFWDLHPTPLVIDAATWARLEAGLTQRARLVNAFLADIYGQQEVLRQRVLPPEVVLADPFYRRPCLRLEPRRHLPAPLLRFDLVRFEQGWHVAETRANTSVGLGIAVQNRRFLSQEAASQYAGLPDYHSIINFPLRLLDSLRELAPQGVRSPSIVVLTSGPTDPFYAEHSFLARKMGLPLARGDDLLVVDDGLHFKTIAGLQRVDVIYRRLNDAHIDPVVFPTRREAAGVPGLLQCIRAGTVTLANGIGSGVADSRALHAYLLPLLRFHLGERPILPSVPTWTCGDNDQLDFVLESRSTMRLLPVHDPLIGDPLLHAPAPVLLDSGGLARTVRENPHAYVARSLAEPGRLEPGNPRTPPFHLSAFVLAQGGGWTVLPGGLVRLGAEPPPVDRVGPCADAIVLQGETVDVHEGPDVDRVAEAPRLNALGSRSAESLFWLGRYLERAESTARMLSIFDDVALEEIPSSDRRHWVPVWRGLLEATGHGAERITSRANPHATLTGDLNWRMTLADQHPSSIASSVNIATENARQLRDYVSPEAWVILSRLEARLQALRRGRLDEERRRKNAAAAVQIVLADVNAFLGTAERTMLMDAGWEFLRMGLHLERAIMTCSALRHVLGRIDEHAAASGGRALSGDSPELSALLRMLGSQDAYRRLYQTRSEPRYVAELFLRQPAAPRSLFHNLSQIRASLRAVVAETPGDHDEAAGRALDDLLTSLGNLRLEPAATADSPGSTPRIGDVVSRILGELYALYPLLSDHYFSHQARVSETPQNS
jgi:uncharacterized circularly permuted ATP-grasp superfamily protein/uncharacterized alpha-E superfamily protein